MNFCHFNTFFRICPIIFALFLTACNDPKRPKNTQSYDFSVINFVPGEIAPKKIKIFTNGSFFDVEIDDRPLETPIFLVFLDGNFSSQGYIFSLNALANRHKNVKFIGIFTPDPKNPVNFSEVFAKTAPNFMILQQKNEKNGKNFLQNMAQRIGAKFLDNAPQIPLFALFADKNLIDFYQGHMPFEILNFELSNL